MHRLQRVKFYHSLCHERFRLGCFYDEEWMCVCDADLQPANCFPFVRNVTLEDKRRNACENGGRFFPDNILCPTASICVCPACFHGSRCQFSTRASRLSLDVILGYRIQPHVPLQRQHLGVRISMIVITCLSVCGLLTSCLSVLTFQKKTSLQAASGLVLVGRLVDIIAYFPCVRAQVLLSSFQSNGSDHQRRLLDLLLRRSGVSHADPSQYNRLASGLCRHGTCADDAQQSANQSLE